MSSTLGPRCSSTIFCVRQQSRFLSPNLHSTTSSTRPSHLPQPQQCLQLFSRQYASKARPSRARASNKSIPPPLPRSGPSPRTSPSTAAVPAAAPSYIPTQDLLAHTLANKASPTLLYLAPTSNSFAISCLGVGAGALSYGLYNFYDAYLVPHPGLWWLVPYLMAGVSVFMIGTGTWIGLGARRLVGSLNAVPVRAARDSIGRATRVAEDTGLMVRLESKPILPFLPMRTIDVPISDLRLGTRVAPVAAGLTTYNSALQAPGQRQLPARETRRAAELRAAKENEEQTLFSVLTGPFRTVMRAGTQGIGRVVARDGFVSLYVQGKMWRIDAREGWLLDEGAALDRLVKAR